MLDTILSHLDTIIAAAGIVGGFIWHKLRGDQTDSVRATLKALVQGVVHDEVGDLDDPAVEAKVRDFVAKRAKAYLAEHKVTGTLADLLVKEAIEIGVAELKRMISTQTALAEAVSDMADKAQKVVDAFKPPANPTVPKLDLNIEVVKPEPVTP